MSAFSDAVVAKSPARYWPLTETSGTTATDLIASEAATCVGLTMGGADGPDGIGGKCPLFVGGVGEFIRLRTGAILGGQNAWTVNAFVRYSASSGSDSTVRAFYGEKGTSGTDQVRCAVSGGSSSPLQHTYGYDGNVLTKGSFETFIYGSWAMLTFTRSAGIVESWWNAGRRLRDTGGVASNTWTNSGVEARIGEQVGATNRWIGRVAHLALWTSVLTEADILALYQAGTPPTRELTTKTFWTPQSPFNQLLTDPANPPTIAANSADLVSKFVSQAALTTVTTNTGGGPLYVVDDDTDTQVVRIKGGLDNGTLDKPHFHDALQVVPIPTPFTSHLSNSDKEVTIYNADTDEMWEFWVMTQSYPPPAWVTKTVQLAGSGSLPAGQYGWYVAVGDGDGPIGPFTAAGAATVNGTQAVELDWSPEDDAPVYNVYRTLVGQGFASARLIAEVDGALTTYLDTGTPNPGTTLMTSEAVAVTTDWSCWHGGYIDGTDDFPGFYQSPRSNWGASATSLPLWAGTVSIQEGIAARTDVDAIGHMICCGLLQSTDSHVFPAQRHDTFSGSFPIPEGTRFQLDPDLDVTTISSNPFVRAYATALQDYGLVIRDHSGDITVAYVEDALGLGRDPYPYIFSGKFGYELFAGFPWSSLRVIDPNWTLEQTQPPPGEISPIDELEDDFSGVSIDAGKWTVSGTTSLSAGQVHVPCGAGVYSGLASAASYDFAGSASGIGFQVSQLPQGNGADQAGFRLVSDLDPNCLVYFWVESGSSIFAAYKNQSAQTIRIGDLAGGIAYDPVAHAWWRMRHAGGVVYWDFSVDGEDWTNWKSFTWTDTGWPSSALTSMKALFFAGNYNSVAGRPDLIIDNVNVSPAVEPPESEPDTTRVYVMHTVNGDHRTEWVDIEELDNL